MKARWCGILIGGADLSQDDLVGAGPPEVGLLRRISNASGEQVLSVAWGALPDGTARIVSGYSDGTLRMWDPDTGKQNGQDWVGHAGPVRSVAWGELPDSSPRVVSGGNDGTVRLWDPSNGKHLGPPWQSDTGDVLSVAWGTLPDGSARVVTGDAWGSIRLWDATARRLIQTIKHAHPRGVLSAVWAELPDGSTRVVSGGADGAVRQWDPVDGHPIGNTLHGHQDWVLSVAWGVLPNGLTRTVSSGSDSRVLLWDPATGEEVSELWRGQPGSAKSMAWGILTDGSAWVVAGGTDGTLRLWDPATDEQLGQPWQGHTGTVRSVAWGARPDGTTLLVSGGDDGTIAIWAVSETRGELTELIEAASQQADNPPSLATDAIRTVDAPSAIDSLGREILAAHTDGLLFSLAKSQPAGTAVVHVDGRWGAGKSSLVEIMLGPDPCAEPRQLQAPVVVRYDAWRESAVAPAWWSVGASLNRGIGVTRARPTRAMMWFTGVVDRIWRTPSAIFAALAFAACLGALAFFEATGDAIRKFASVVTAVVGLVALALTLGRALFWTSPTFGRLDLKADDNPLGEIAKQVGRMRRWSPRRRGEQALGDWLLFIWLSAWLGIAIWQVLSASAPAGIRSLEFEFGKAQGPLLLTAMMIGLGLLVYGVWLESFAASSKAPILLVIDDLDRCEAKRVVGLMETVHTILREDNPPRVFRQWRRPAPLLVLVLADGRWVRTAFSTAFSDFKELGSDVHSLGADFVQKLFDHTVIVPSLSATQVDDLARFISGSPAKARGGTAPTTGSDLVAVGLVGNDTNAINGERTPEDRDEVGERDGGALARQSLDVAEIGQLLDTMKPADVYSNEEVNQAIKSLDRASQALVGAKRAAKAATGEATQAREHVLTQYAPLLPSNPRLIKRVANAWGMLMALGDHVGHQEDQDVVIRAAILMVRFPVLVDALLTDVDLPSGVAKQDDQDRDTGELPVAERLWRRSDVQAVVGDYTPRQFARCFGRDLGELPPEEPRPFA